MTSQPRRFAFSSVVLALAALLAAGCASEMSKAEYEGEMRKISKDVDRSVGNIGGSEQDRMSRAREELEKGIGRIEDLDPPKRVESAHDNYVEGLKGTSKVMEKYEDFDPEKQEDAEATLEMFEELREPVEKIEKAQAQFKEAGYRISSS